MLDFDVQRCSRRCAATDREFAPGETIISALVADGGNVVRRDYSVASWSDPPPGVIGWWKHETAAAGVKKPEQTPGELLLAYFEQLEGDATKADVRYFLALLMVRRKIFRQEAIDKDDTGAETLVLFCPRNEAEYRTPVAMPDEERLVAVRTELNQLLQADG